MLKKVLALVVLGASVTGCAVVESQRVDASGQAFAMDSRVADCDRISQRLTSPEETTASAPWSGTPWTDAREWNVATASSKPQIERDIRWFVYRECLGTTR